VDWLPVAAQLLPRRDKPDGSMTFATDAIAMRMVGFRSAKVR
jgi:hypothetical protein